MAILKPFKGFRPTTDIAEKLASLPYDVMNSQEAALMANENPYSLLHITRSEIDCPTGMDVHAQEVYDKAVENYTKFKK